MPDFTVVTNTALADKWRDILAEQDTRKLVEWDSWTDQERTSAFGLCQCGTPIASRLTVILDDEGRVHHLREAACPACDGKP